MPEGSSPAALRVLPDGGCFFSDPVSIDGTNARVVWDPLQFSGLLRLLAVPAGGLEGLIALDLWGSTADRIMIKHAEMQIVLLRQGACSLQLNVHGAVEGKVHLFAEAVSRKALEERKQVLDALSDLQRTGRLRPERFRAYPRGLRLRQVLHALDGYLAGDNHRCIAAALFGEDRVTAEWSDPRCHLRDTVRRAVSRGRWLMSGGYRSLVG